MAPAALLRRLTWRAATVAETVVETPTATTLVLDVDGWPGHRAGQHVDVRLTAADGYQASRSYSIASAPGADRLELTVERIDDGEVSPWMADLAEPGDQFEVRGPIGGYFVWDEADPAPVTLVAGGSGVVPLMSMLRHRAATGVAAPMRLLYSARSLDRLIYGDELIALAQEPGVDLGITLTRDAPANWEGFRRRVDAEMLRRVAWPATDRPAAFVCGPTAFVDTVAAHLLALGYPPETIKTERFGASGG